MLRQIGDVFVLMVADVLAVSALRVLSWPRELKQLRFHDGEPKVGISNVSDGLEFVG